MSAAKRVKNGTWEKNRRQKLNLRFLELCKLLPDHDPTLNIPKVEILTKAIAYIKELQQQFANMVECCFNSTMKSEIAALSKQATDLRLRNQQLAELLQRAEIGLPGPPAPHRLPFTTPRKWAGKIKKSDVKHVLMEKETIILSKKKTNENKMRPKKKSKITPQIKRNLRSSVKPLKEITSTSSDVGESSTSTPLREIRNVLPVSTTVLTQATGTPPSPVLTGTGRKTNLVTVSKTNILTAPIMATGIQPVLERNPALSRLGPGTLILPDGRVVAMPPPRPTQIIVMPRLVTADTTNTTFVNKVPIPAISAYKRVDAKAPVADLLKRKGPGNDDCNASIRPKKMLLSMGNQTEKRTVVKAVKRRSQKQKTVKLSHVKIIEPAKASAATIDRVENKNNLNIAQGTNDNAKEKANTLEKTNRPETVGNKLKTCENNMEINISSVKLNKAVESRSAGNEISVSSSGTNKNDLTSNIHLVCEKSQTNHENGSSEKIETLPSVKQVDRLISNVVVNNSVPASSENPKNEHHTTENIKKCDQRIDDTHKLISIGEDAKISKIQNEKLPSSEISTDLVQNIKLLDKKVTSTINNVSATNLSCYGMNVGEQQSITNRFTSITTDNEQDNQTRKAVLARSSSVSINKSQHNTAKDDATPKPNNEITTKNITCITSNEKQPSISRSRDGDQNVANTHKNNEYYAKERESLKLIPESIPSTHELDQINVCHNPTTAELPTISKNRSNVQVSHSESSVASSSLDASNKSVPSEYCIGSENMQRVNVSNAGMIGIQESATNAPLNASKSTQITSLENKCPVNSMTNKSSQSSESAVSTEAKKINSATAEKKSSDENKSTVTDVNSELTNLFPSDVKLPACSESIFKDNDRNLFMPISHSYMDEIRLSLPHADFSNDLFSSLHVPTGGQHPESISPTAAFLLAFPLVSTSKASELIADNEVAESQHATPTTILQIGNIEGAAAANDLYHQTSIMIDNNLTNIQESLKLDRTADNVKNGDNLKHQKDFDSNFNKLHQMEINEFVRNDNNYSRNNYKEKKHFSAVTDHDLFLSCNKKKASGKMLDYALSSDVSNNFQEKFFEFGSNNARSNLLQNSSHMETRQGGSNNNNNQKKDHVPLENMVNQQTYVASSQSYTYHTFPSGNDCSMPNSNCLATNRVDNGSLKPPQTLPSYQAIPWSSASVTATSNSANYVAPYNCSHQQKPYTSVPNKNVQQKTLQHNFEDHRLKEKNSFTGNVLPKFSSNFQFHTNNQSVQDVHSYPQTNLPDPSFKTDSKPKKQKTNSQRAPVNWMTTPDVRSVMPDINSAPMLPDVMFQPQKDVDFNSATNNGMLGSSSNIQSSSLPNSNQSLYQNTHFSAVDLQLDFVTMPDITASSKPSRCSSSIPNSQQNPHYSWSPSKSSISLLPHIEGHMIPSTLPTLVGDLALGTTTPSGPLDNCRTLALPSTPFILDQPNKKCEIKPDAQKQIGRKSSDKECFTERRNNNGRNMQEYCQKSHAHQSTNTTSSFLSVSQLVDHTKSEQNSSRRTSKQSVNKNNSANLPKRNVNVQQQEKPNSSKMSNMHGNISNYHPANRGLLNQRKSDFPVYQENPPVGFLGHPPPYKGGSYSAESLIGDHGGPPSQDQISELPPFSVGNQFANQFSHSQKPLVPSSGSDYSQQNVQPLEFHQTQHTQNCFNYNTHYPGSSYNPDNDYHLGIDQFYNFNQSSSASRNSTSCQTSSHGNRDSRSVAQKRAKRREETQFKCPPNHPVTTTLANFNLSTIFPEINDKRSVQGPNTFHPSGNKPNEGSSTRPGGPYPALVSQVGMPPHFPPVNFRPQ